MEKGREGKEAKGREGKGREGREVGDGKGGGCFGGSSTHAGRKYMVKRRGRGREEMGWVLCVVSDETGREQVLAVWYAADDGGGVE